MASANPIIAIDSSLRPGTQGAAPDSASRPHADRGAARVRPAGISPAVRDHRRGRRRSTRPTSTTGAVADGLPSAAGTGCQHVRLSRRRRATSSRGRRDGRRPRPRRALGLPAAAQPGGAPGARRRGRGEWTYRRWRADRRGEWELYARYTGGWRAYANSATSAVRRCASAECADCEVLSGRHRRRGAGRGRPRGSSRAGPSRARAGRTRCRRRRRRRRRRARR